MRNSRWMISFVLLLLAAGCAQPAGVIFPPVNPPLLWPGGSEPPRIRYVGQLATSADLKPSVPFLEGVGNALFGKKPVSTMLTPYALCTDNQDRLFVADSNAQVVHVFDLKTRKYERWQPAPKHLFAQPVGVAYDTINNRLWVSDSVAGTIYVFDSNGHLVKQMPTGLFARPTGLCFDKTHQRMFIVDTSAHHIVVCTLNGQPITILGHRGAGLGEFNFPTNVAVDSVGRVYVSDSLNFRVQEFSPDLKPIRAIGSKGDLPGYFGQPKGVACDSQNHLYVVDANFEAVQIFDSSGHLLLNFGQEGTKNGEFWLPAGICIDSHDRIWVADCYNRRVEVFDYLPETQR